MFAWTLIISWKNIFQWNMNREDRKFSLKRVNATVEDHLQVLQAQKEAAGHIVMRTYQIFTLALDVTHVGAYPIRGKRYKCKDCTELVGFDLCEACYNSSSKLPGRFNQQHTPDHRMELDNSALLQRLMMEEAVAVPGAMVQIVFGNQGMGGNDGGPGDAAMGELVGAPGDMLHIVIDDQEGMGDNGEEDQEA
ncbi:E3 ubiquitin-protein ligase PRT1 [Panicum miliaceum]|uniref:E3 ubiquitin-protein ligase PRT1 n=1 Tax=Panicum miliaceum TaxID=4540 RepID=A0A3L6QDQ4_PANMI|nr:E3 ubiquitin-protein ligase PRT1 [Panicum miliaceum]